MHKFDESKIISIAEETLKSGKHYEGNGCKLADLIGKIKKEIKKQFGEEVELKDSKIYGVLLDEVKSEDGVIRSGGPHKGYYIIKDDNKGKDSYKIKIQEKDLYPIVEMWIKEKKSYDIIGNVSNKTKGGKWGNPDVVGISFHNNFGINYIEMVTVEVKPSMQEWRQFIFEAVSHKRFSDKVYYIFGCHDDKYIPDMEEMFYYAEKYKIGICKLHITENVQNWDKLDDGKKLEVMDNSIIELFPAPIDNALVREKIKFLEKLGVRTQVAVS